jgi:hypothetical protein
LEPEIEDELAHARCLERLQGVFHFLRGLLREVGYAQ